MKCLYFQPSQIVQIPKIPLLGNRAKFLYLVYAVTMFLYNNGHSTLQDYVKLVLIFTNILNEKGDKFTLKGSYKCCLCKNKNVH